MDTNLEQKGLDRFFLFPSGQSYDVSTLFKCGTMYSPE
jgi:hypothetical protein